MNTTQAMIVLNNGIKKYGIIINGEYEGEIKFVQGLDAVFENDIQSHLIERIPISTIFSIDTFLK